MTWGKLWVAVCVALAVLAMLSPAEAQRRRGIPITLESTPPGATVTIGEENLGTTPLRNVRVPRGEHTVTFTLEGYEPHQETVNVRRRRARTTVTLVREARLSVAGPAAEDARVRVDGEEVGALPYAARVVPGRHLVEVTRPGFITHSQWVEVAAEQSVSLTAVLEREPPRSGSVLVAGGVPGAEIRVDGEVRGATPMVIDGLAEGVHRLEIIAEGLPPHSQEVVIRAGQRTVVAPDLRAAARGRLTVIASAPGATLRVDGELHGELPASDLELAAGEHILEVTAPGRQPAQRTITVEAGQRRAISIELEEEPRRPGRLVIEGGVPGARVTVDGEPRGEAPLVLSDLSSGPHAIVIEADGYESLRTTCEVEPEQDCRVSATLRGRDTPVVVSAPGLSGAELWVDGELAGPVPFQGMIASGSHRFEVRAPGHDPHIEQVMLQPAAEPRSFEVSLMRTQVGPSEEERREAYDREQRLATEALTHGAAPLPEGLAVVDVSVGWPHVAEARVGVGLLDWIDAGFAIRSFGRLTEFEARSTVGFRPIELLGVGGRLRVGGGVGPDDVNSFALSLEALVTLYFGGHGGLTIWIAADGHTDRYDWTETDSSVAIGNPGDRQDLIRARLGGSIEWAIDRHWGIFGNLEGILGSTGGGRRVYGDIFGFGNSDTQIYFRLGGTYKF